jgi:hypothetical protein
MSGWMDGWEWPEECGNVLCRIEEENKIKIGDYFI